MGKLASSDPEYFRQYRADNREKINQRMRLWRKGEKINRRTRLWRKGEKAKCESEPVQPIRVAAGPANFAAADATLARAIQRSATTYKVPVIAMGPCMSALASGVERAFVREFVEGGSVDAASLESGLPCKTIDKPTVRAAIVEHARKRSLELAGMIAHYAEPVE